MSVKAEFNKEFSQDSLRETYYSAIRYRSAVGVDRVNTKTFEENLTENIELILRKTHKGIYRFSQYREKLLSRGQKKLPRVIAIPTIRDKLTLKALSNILASIAPFNVFSLHSIVADIATNYLTGKYKSVLHLDVENYYPSIRHDLLVTELEKAIKDSEMLELIKNAIKQAIVPKPEGKGRTFKSVGMPQGLSISNILANVYLMPLDEKHSKKTTYKYYRYVDDILILCNEKETEQIKKEIIADCYKRGLPLHEETEGDSKTASGKISEGFSYLGYTFKPSGITVRNKSVDHLRDSIIKIFTNYKYSKTKNLRLLEWAIDLRITGCIFDNTRYGWLFFFSQINDMSLLHSLDHFIIKMCKRFNIDAGAIKFKLFVRAYHEITKNIRDTKYIPNFDELSIGDKRKILLDIFGWKAERMTEGDIEYQFKKRIYRTVRELEQDLARDS